MPRRGRFEAEVRPNRGRGEAELRLVEADCEGVARTGQGRPRLGEDEADARRG